MTRVTSPGLPLDGHDLAGVTPYLLEPSSRNISFSGSGRLPTYVSLGPGSDWLTGAFTLSGQIGNFVAGGGFLTIDATIYFAGSEGSDRVRTGSGDDSSALGAGVNFVDGGAGVDRVDWSQAVNADWATWRATPRTPGLFDDTFINVEGIGGSPIDDILLGSNANSRIDGTSVSPGTSGNDILGGRGGDNVFVHVLGAIGEIGRGKFISGAAGADRYIIDPSRGRWRSLGIEFSQIDGDKCDLSMLRCVDGNVLTLADIVAAASAQFCQGVVIDLARFEDAAGNAP